MSSALERLKALAAARKAAEAQKDGNSSVQETPAAVPAQQQPVPSEVSGSEGVQVLSGGETGDDSGHSPEPEADAEQVLHPQDVLESAEVPVPAPSFQSDNPIAMELAELEAQLNANVPDFRHKLRDIHQKLRQDPEIVTIMTDEEIGLVFQALVRHANAEIVAPKAMKAAKAAAKKTPISADDL